MRRSEISKVHDPRTRSCYMLCSVAMYSYVLHTLDEQDVASKYARYQKLVCFNCHKTAKKHIFSFLPVFMTVPEYQNTSSSTSHAAGDTLLDPLLNFKCFICVYHADWLKTADQAVTYFRCKYVTFSVFCCQNSLVFMYFHVQHCTWLFMM